MTTMKWDEIIWNEMTTREKKKVSGVNKVLSREVQKFGERYLCALHMGKVAGRQAGRIIRCGTRAWVCLRILEWMRAQNERTSSTRRWQVVFYKLLWSYSFCESSDIMVYNIVDPLSGGSRESYTKVALIWEFIVFCSAVEFPFHFIFFSSSLLFFAVVIITAEHGKTWSLSVSAMHT